MLYNNKREKKIQKVIKMLDDLQKEFPDTKIILETPNGTASCLIKDAIIFEGLYHELVIDSE